MNGPLVFRAPPGLMIKSLLFCVASAFTVYLCWEGLQIASGVDLLLLRVASFFPALIFVAATLLMLSVISRRVTLDERRLAHRQLFKNFDLTLADIIRLEARRSKNDRDGQIDTVKIFTSGQAFYIDAKAIAGFDVFADVLAKRLPKADKVTVVAFAPACQPGSTE